MSIISVMIYSYIGLVSYWNNRELSKVNTWIKDRNIRKEVYKNFEGKVLDMCCGTGFSTKPGNIGIDTSLDMLRFSKIFNPGNDYRYGNAERFGKDDEFDTVSIMFAFHEMPLYAHNRIIENAFKIAKREIIIVDIASNYEPKDIMISGEPYLLDYMSTIDNTLSCFNKTVYIDKHVNIWRYKKF